MSIAFAMSKVAHFHKQIGAPMSHGPSIPQCDHQQATEFAKQLYAMRDSVRDAATESNCPMLQRATHSIEELAEWLEAVGKNDIVALADAWADRMYVLLGDAVVNGLPAQALFDEVAKSNLTKMQKVTDGHRKAVKGEDYQRPAIEGVLDRHRKSLEAE